MWYSAYSFDKKEMVHVDATRTINVRSMCYVGVFAALMAVCSWIAVPTAVPFTLQTLGVFLAVGLLGGKLGTAAVVVYVLLGAFGLPVFANFSGGAGVLLSNTGGYIIGFIFSALFMWAMEHLLGRRTWVLLVSMLAGLVICYAFGTAWFMLLYMRTTGPVGLVTVLGWCVFPFVVPDLLKILLAMTITARLRPYVR